MRLEKEAELRRLRKEDELRALRAEDESSPTEHPDFLANMRGAAAAMQAATPFIGTPDQPGPFRKMNYAVGAAKDAISDQIDGKPAKAMSEYYDQAQKRQDEGWRKAMAESSATARGVGYAGGMGVSMLAPIPGSTARTLGGAASRIGGAAGMAALERGLSSPDVPFDAEEAWNALKDTGGFQGAIEAGAPILGKAGSRLGQWAEDSAASRALKAATGWTESFMKKFTKAERREMGRQLLSADEAGGPVVGRFSNTEDIVERVKPKRDFYGQRLGETGRVIDEVSPGNAISGKAIASDLRTWAEENLSSGHKVPYTEEVASGLVDEFGNPITRLVEKEKTVFNPDAEDRLRAIEEQAKYFEDIGDIPFQVAHQEKVRNYKKKNPQDRTSPYKGIPEIDMAAKGAIGREQERAAQRVAAANPEHAALADEYVQAKRKYAAYEPVLDQATERAARNEGIRWLSPSDLAVGGLTGVAAGVGQVAKGGDLEDAFEGALPGLGVALLHKQVRTRGSAFAARGLQDTVDIARSSGSKALRNALRNGKGAFTGAQIQDALMQADLERRRKEYGLSPNRP